MVVLDSTIVNIALPSGAASDVQRRRVGEGWPAGAPKLVVRLGISRSPGRRHE